MTDAKIADTQPTAAELEAGKDYWWCACGRSSSQPFCDGSHKAAGMAPVKFTAEKSDKGWLCMCKRTKNPPYCDGSHNNL